MGLDRIGTFRCKALEWGVNLTSQKKLPQFIVRVFLTEIYDQKEEKWFDYTGFEGEISAYLCLYGANKKKDGEIGPTLSMDQVKKVFGWDGRSMAQLANGNYSELEFQVRIGENTYEEATYLYQVDWIDEYDADPACQLRKLDAKELKDLDKQFAALSAKNATPKPVATAAKAPHPARVPADDAAPDTPAEKKVKMAAKSVKNKVAAAKAKVKTALMAGQAAEPPVTSTPPPKPALKDAIVPPPKSTKTACTMNEAWCEIVDLRDPSIDDKTIGEVWHASIAEIAGPDAKSEDVNEDQWYLIKEKTLESVAKF